MLSRISFPCAGILYRGLAGGASAEDFWNRVDMNSSSSSIIISSSRSSRSSR